MKVKDILESVCLYLDLTEELEPVFNGGSLSEEVENEYKKLILAINLTTQELCYKAMPLTTIEKVVTLDKTIIIKDLTKKAINIVQVKNNQNKKQKFKIVDDKIVLNNQGTFEVTYNYLLNSVSSCEDEIDLNFYLSLKTFVYGVVSEYYNINGLFEESKVFHEKFLTAIKQSLKQNKCFTLPKRRWF